jgi:hypothetical protein
MYPEFEVKTIQYEEDTGTKLFRELLISQYAKSANLQEYISAYIAEVDLLFKEAQRLYQGRFIEYATGHQLDVIGEILGQGRGVVLPFTYFGFSDLLGGPGAPGLVAGMADEATPDTGGIFKDGSQPVYESQPLDDATYRRVLWATAKCSSNFYKNVDFAYDIITTLLGRTPATLELGDLSAQKVGLALGNTEVTGPEAQLIAYMSRYFMPAATILLITLV